ncbi:MAG: HlyD family secretion protein [Vampirovibrionales bacterium]|jgi:multidrug resistance efflux pump|nr:HlyD family secretion protein [Vampirovibrionales bacterium]
MFKKNLKPLNWKLIPFSKTIPIAILGVLIMLYYVNTQVIAEPEREPTRTPAAAPYGNAVTGAGIIEPVDEAVKVAPFYSGKVVAIYVKEDQAVKKGQALFKLDTSILDAQRRRLLADASASKSRLGAAQARLHRLGAEPRDVMIPPLKAKVASLQANLNKEKDKLKRLESVADSRAISEQELTQQRLAVDVATAQVAEADATLKATLAGAWQPELDEAKALAQEASASVNSVLAQVKELDVQLAQAVVKAPKDGTVLQINIRVGETVQLMQMSGKSSEPAILMGNVNALQVRVDIDEVLAPQVQAGMHAKAFIKGNSKLSFPLNFERIEPFMVPKVSLTGGTAERNDVRVLQVIYRFTPPAGFSIYPGQQVDVYLDADTFKPKSTASEPLGTTLELPTDAEKTPNAGGSL